MQLRPLLPDEEPLVWQFLLWPSYENSLQVAQNSPNLNIYAQHWGRNGDCGVVAHESGQPIGLVWARLYPETAPGYGWVSADVPELGVAVHPEHRGQGVGRAMLSHFLATKHHHFPGFSLSVRAENTAAVRLYNGCGFTPVPGTEEVNAAGSTSYVMCVESSRLMQSL